MEARQIIVFDIFAGHCCLGCFQGDTLDDRLLVSKRLGVSLVLQVHNHAYFFYHVVDHPGIDK